MAAERLGPAAVPGVHEVVRQVLSEATSAVGAVVARAWTPCARIPCADGQSAEADDSYVYASDHSEVADAEASTGTTPRFGGYGESVGDGRAKGIGRR